MRDFAQFHRQLGTTMKLTQFAVDDGPHNSDGLLRHGWDGDRQVTGFISRRVMDDWSIPNSLTESGKAFIASSTTRLASATSRRSSESSHRMPARPGVQSPIPVCRRILLSDITESVPVFMPSKQQLRQHARATRVKRLAED